MKGRIRQLFRRLRGISTPFGGISWAPANDPPEIESFGETVCITLPTNEPFIAFLERNAGKVIFLNLHLDASVALQEQWNRVEEEHIDLDRFSSGRFSGVALPLPNRMNQLVGVTFHFLEGHVLTASSGGTGTVVVPVTGFFEVSPTFHGGPSRIFHLKEIEAPITLRAEFLTRRVTK